MHLAWHHFLLTIKFILLIAATTPSESIDRTRTVIYDINYVSADNQYAVPIAHIFPSSSSLTIHPTFGSPVTLPAGITTSLAISSQDELLSLSRITTVIDDDNGMPSTVSVPAGRSYDTYDWEPVHPLLFSFDCSSRIQQQRGPTVNNEPLSSPSCLVSLPFVPGQTVHYIVEAFQRQNDGSNSAMRAAARLLMQGTFGPTRDTIPTITSPSSWIAHQMSLPITSLREHYRKRTSTRLRDVDDRLKVHDPCEIKSRWNRFAFGVRDVGKIITWKRLGNGNLMIMIDGRGRTELSPSDASNWNPTGIDPPYVICRLNEYVGGDIMLVTASSVARKSNCEDVRPFATVPNPPISFSVESLSPSSPFPVFDAAQPTEAHLVDLSPKISDVKILSSFRDNYDVTTCYFSAVGPLFIRNINDNAIYIHDRRMRYVNNTPPSSQTVTTPLGSRQNCPSAPKTFLNEETCLAARGEDCSPPTYATVTVRLDAETLRRFYTLDGLYVYRINGLRLDDDASSPCTGRDDTYRFIRRATVCETGDGTTNDGHALSPVIKQALINRIEDAMALFNPDEREHIRVLDVVFPESTCHDPGRTAVGASVFGGGGCWTHVHSNEWDVYDFTIWVMRHFGNPEAYKGGRTNPIARPAEEATDDDGITLNYPGWHPMNRFEEIEDYFPYLGRFGDVVDFSTFDVMVQGPRMASYIGATVLGRIDEGFEVCGSPGEVASDPQQGDHYHAYREGDIGELESYNFDQDHDKKSGKSMVWSTVVLNAKDQLRHRVAWALASIFTVSTEEIGEDDEIEEWAQYYDIFVRQAFGTFKNILKQVSFSPMMGRMLSYEGSTSLSHNIEAGDMMQYPDENYAREVMQLFTIGQWHLQPDGTQYLDPLTRRPVPTFKNDDIMNFARAWTGFEENEGRSNIEFKNLWHSGENLIDPMRIETKDTRDLFPKCGLSDKSYSNNGTSTSVQFYRGYIGDGVPLCNALPQHSYLKKGAKYRYLGSRPYPDLGRADQEAMTSDGDYPTLVLNPISSRLYAALCHAAVSNGSCRFRSTVILTENLPCDNGGGVGSDTNACTAGLSGPISSQASNCECVIDEPRVVRLGTHDIYYEYIPASCVQLSFIEQQHLRAVGMIGSDAQEDRDLNHTMCADRRRPAAASACCERRRNGDYRTRGKSVCIFRGERVTFDTAVRRCAATENESKVCTTWETVARNQECGTDTEKTREKNKAGLKFAWADAPCSILAQVDAKGQVAIIHDVDKNHLPFPVRPRVSPETGTYIRVLWNKINDSNITPYPHPSSGCGGNGSSCRIVPRHQSSSSLSCLCPIQVRAKGVFDGTYIPDYNELLARLFVAAPDPSTFDGGTYVVCDTPVCQDKAASVIVHLKTTAMTGGGSFDVDTIFELVDITGIDNRGMTPSRFLSNIISTVHIDEQYSFRNPPSFHNPVDPSPRDALYETDAVIDHYQHHSNTAPFVANSLIRSMVTSNPSPRYIAEVAMAFRTGRYDHSFGSGTYGDLSATVAAVLLDREARSETLDEDSTFGSLREPLVKLMHFLRAMELRTIEEEDGDRDDHRREVEFNALISLGQEAFHAPAVFGFFLPDYQPASGPVRDTDLYAPEAQLLDAPRLVNYLNAMVSLPDFGFTNCDGGLGSRRERYMLKDNRAEGTFSCRRARDFDASEVRTPLRLRWVPSGTDGAAVVSEMELLLTGGRRLTATNREIIIKAYDDTVATEWRDYPHEKAIRLVQKLFAITPEYHISNRLMNGVATTNIRNVVETTPVVANDPPPVTDYKAIIYLYMRGGMDSFSMLVPHSECTNNLAQQYQTVRSNVAINHQSLLPIQVPTNDQPCRVFGIHPSLSLLKQLYDSGDASFVANMGSLIEPIDSQTEYDEDEKLSPPSLFSHNSQKNTAHTVYAQDSKANGILGRIGDAINAAAAEGNMSSEDVFDAYSIDGVAKVLEGDSMSSSPSRIQDVLDASDEDSSILTERANDIKDVVEKLNERIATSIFGETYSNAISHTLKRIESIEEALEASSPSSPPVDDDCASIDTSIAKQLRLVARVIGARNHLQAKRDAFYVEYGNFDTHSDGGTLLSERLTDVNEALSCLVRDLRDRQNIWANVTVIQASEFGRTLTSNGRGTDHAWGGNYFILGGTVKGGRIHGRYPTDLTEAGPLNIGRGRLIPSTPWEGLWKPVAEWFGVTAEYMTTVLPNLKNFRQEHIIARNNLFENFVAQPTELPTKNPSKSPTKSPTKRPSQSPTKSPTKMPSQSPTKSPTKRPSQSPTKSPTKRPSQSPTKSPTKMPSQSPTKSPTKRPSQSPTKSPTKRPSQSPTKSPTRTKSPTKKPTVLPTKSPSKNATPFPTKSISKHPTPSPTLSPSAPKPDISCRMHVEKKLCKRDTSRCCKWRRGTCIEKKYCQPSNPPDNNCYTHVKKRLCKKDASRCCKWRRGTCIFHKRCFRRKGKRKSSLKKKKAIGNDIAQADCVNYKEKTLCERDKSRCCRWKKQDGCKRKSKCKQWDFNTA